MFIPVESSLAAAVEYDRGLLEDGMAKRVLVATPISLIALLKAVAYGWRQEQLARNGQDNSALGQEMHARIGKVVEHLGRIGKGLGGATDAYNEAVGSFNERLVKTAEKFVELGADSGKDVPQIEPVDVRPR